MKTEKIEIGSNVYDIDIKSLTPAELEQLQATLYENRIIVIKNQHITEQDYVDFAGKFGYPEAYLQSHYNRSFCDHPSDNTHQELLAVTSMPRILSNRWLHVAALPA